MPMFFATCTDNENINLYGEILCLACDEFKPTSIEDLDLFALKVFKHLNMYRRHQEIKHTEGEIIKAFIKSYTGFGYTNVSKLI
jgi:recombinational DNA repair protein (RecF pathway)